MARLLERGGYTYSEVSPGMPPGHTMCAVTIDPTVGRGNQSDQRLQTLEGCNGTENREITCIPPITSKLERYINLVKRRKKCKNFHLQVHLFGMVF